MGKIKNFFYCLFHYKAITEELSSLREKNEQNKVIVANYDKQVRRLKALVETLEKELEEKLNKKTETKIMSIHIPRDYGEKIYEFTNYGDVKVHDRLNYWSDSSLDKILDELKDE